MLDTLTLALGLRAIAHAARVHEFPKLPEPEFKRFVFPKRDAAEVRAENTTQAPRTLEELGIPRGFAAELESTLRALGAVEGDRIVGFTFRTPDGVLHALRTGDAPARTRAENAGKAA